VKRRLFTILSALSLLMFAAVALSWGAALVLSVAPNAARWAQPYVAWRDGPTHGYAIMVTRRDFSLEARSLPWPTRGWPNRSIYDPSPNHVLESVDRLLVRMVRIPDRTWLGFEKGYWAATVGNGVISGPTRGDYVSVPLWFLLLTFGALPVLWGVRAARTRRRKRGGLCRRCGYDLRATPGRCPECGQVAASSSSPSGCG
jgi:hypothetical protein